MCSYTLKIAIQLSIKRIFKKAPKKDVGNLNTSPLDRTPQRVVEMETYCTFENPAFFVTVYLFLNDEQVMPSSKKKKADHFT